MTRPGCERAEADRLAEQFKALAVQALRLTRERDSLRALLRRCLFEIGQHGRACRATGELKADIRAELGEEP